MNVELKDYFAAKIMQTLLSKHPSMQIDNVIASSYNIAERMIEHKHKLVNEKYVNSSKQLKLDNVENL